MNTTTKTIWQDTILLFLSLAMVFSILLGSRPLTTPDEGRYAEIPRQMILHNDFVTPRINNIKYFEKPPLFYWLQTASVKTFGLNEWSVRIATALMGLLGCVFTYFAGTQLFDRRTGLNAAIILASSSLYFGLSRYITLDITVAVFISISLLCFMLFNKTQQNRYLYGLYAASALATLTKGFIGFILPGAIIFVWIALTHSWKQLLRYRLVTGTVLFLVIALPWHILAQMHNSEFLSYYVLDQQILRYFTDISGRGQALWFLPGVLIAGMLPWTPWILPSVSTAWKQYRTKKDGTFLMLLIWPALTFAFFWLSKSQLSPYILPMFPALALLLSHHFSELIKKPHTQKWPLGALWLCIMIICIVANIRFKTGDPDILLSVGLLVFSGVLATIIYRKTNLQTFIVTLALSFTLFIISLNISLPKHDTRSIKPLAQMINKIKQPGDMIASYHYLYLDLPVYINQNVTIVDYYGELKYGIHHQNTDGVWIQTEDYWHLWRSDKQRILMVMKTQDYVNYIGQSYYKMVVLARTNNAVLISNRGL